MNLTKLTKFSAYLFCLTPIICSTLNAGDLNAFYHSDYEGFWKYWNQTKIEATSCKSSQKTAIFLSNALITSGNTEVTEANAEVIEDLAFKNPRCLLEAINRLDQQNQKRFMKFFLLSPIFNSAEDIEECLNKIWGMGDYIDLRSLFQEIKTSS